MPVPAEVHALRTLLRRRAVRGALSLRRDGRAAQQAAQIVMHLAAGQAGQVAAVKMVLLPLGIDQEGGGWPEVPGA